MSWKRIAVVSGTVVLAAAASAGVLVGGSDDEATATGPEADRAVRAAVEETGGTANAVERDPDGRAVWEVEVTRPDGTTVDVELDAGYTVLSVEGDSDAGEPEGVEADEPGDRD